MNLLPNGVLTPVLKKYKPGLTKIIDKSLHIYKIEFGFILSF